MYQVMQIILRNFVLTLLHSFQLLQLQLEIIYLFLGCMLCFGHGFWSTLPNYFLDQSTNVRFESYFQPQAQRTVILSRND